MIVGAPFDDDNGANSGSAYVFEGLNETKLRASDGVQGDLFGVSVAMNGDGVLIGATKADGAERDSGQVYLYTDDGGGGGGGDGEGGDGGSFATIQTTVFDGFCVSCHGVIANAGLDLRSPQSYDNLVDVPSAQTDLLLVAPGDPEASYLLHKLEGRGTTRMPLFGPSLSEDQIATVRSWIAAGAQNN